MPDIKITAWKAIRALILFVFGAIVMTFLQMPEASLTLGAVLVGIENWLRVEWEEHNILNPVKK